MNVDYMIGLIKKYREKFRNIKNNYKYLEYVY